MLLDLLLRVNWIQLHTTEKCTYAEHCIKCEIMREISVLTMKMMKGMFYTFSNN